MRRVCIPPHNKDEQLLLMETGSPGHCSGCVPDEGLDRLPIFVPADTYPDESPQGDRVVEDQVSVDCSILAIQAMVPQSPEDEAGRNSPSPGAGLPDSQSLQSGGGSCRPSLRLPPGWKPSRKTEGLSEAAKTLVDLNIRKSSRAQYNSKFTVFAQYCQDHDKDPYTCSPYEGVPKGGSLYPQSLNILPFKSLKISQFSHIPKI